MISTVPGGCGDQFRYDPAEDPYVSNLGTKDSSFLGSYTYRLIATVDSGQILEVEFSLK